MPDGWQALARRRATWTLVHEISHMFGLTHGVPVGPDIGSPHRPGPPPGPDMAIDAAIVSTVIDGVAKNLTDAYVFPDVAGKMVAAIRDRQQRHEYDAITSARTLDRSRRG